MKIDVTQEEAAIILDGLAALPLGRSYNVFTKLYRIVNENRPTPSPELQQGYIDAPSQQTE